MLIRFLLPADRSVSIFDVVRPAVIMAVAIGWLCVNAPAGALAQNSSPRPAAPKIRIVNRLFWQDAVTKSVMWGDLTAGSKWEVKPAQVAGFPQLDPKRQTLVQMKIIGQVLLVGVRDEEDGSFGSGWVAIDTGVGEEPHGDHSHWVYLNPPRVLAAVIDAEQGNPAHLYAYDNMFYLAQDARNGFSQIDPVGLLKGKGKAAARFFPGGGGHITIAAANNDIAFSTWIAREGDDAGRVDVVDLKARQPAIVQSFQLPSGGIHGAIATSGRAFFAPADGICWVDIPQRQSMTKAPPVHTLSLGTSASTSKPNRTGAFVALGSWLLMTTGRDAESTLCLVNAAANPPAVMSLPLETAAGFSLVTPVVTRSVTARKLALVFQNAEASAGETSTDGGKQDGLVIVDLDPNNDNSFADARPQKRIAVGRSCVEGHNGHHSMCFDPRARYATIANPGDGTLSVLSLEDYSILATLQVGGQPESIASRGGPAGH